MPPLQVVRRLGIAAAQILWLPPALLDGAPGDAVKDALLRAVACVAGPFAPAQTEGARAWLNAGARGALFTAEVGSSPTRRSRSRRWRCRRSACSSSCGRPS